MKAQGAALVTAETRRIALKGRDWLTIASAPFQG